MVHILCNLWAILLGAALVSAGRGLYVLWRDGLFGGGASDADQVPHGPPAPHILYLTPRAAAALGRCSRPGRLRRMTPQCIERLLTRFPFPQSDPRPSPERFATWPDQAKLLCAGKFPELAAFQDGLRNKYGDPEEASDDPPMPPYGGPTVPLAWLLFAALLFLSALLAWWAAHNSTCCTTTITPTNPEPFYVDTPRGRTTVNLSADLIFDFGKDQPRSPAHAEKLIASLKDLFREFDGIRIVSVAAYTDPIGGTADNVALGQRRAATIRAIIAGLIATPERPDQFGPDPMPPDSVPDGPNKDEAHFWRTCFKQYMQDVKPSFQPLVDLRADKNSDKRVLCSAASETDVFPACARREKPRPQARISYAYVEQAEGLREMTACLAPMRHVAIRFSYKRLIPKEIDATASQ